ncbi:head GIN domain-containing protein [Sphingosinicella sp.]|uniref:head GIN domain-containing protein n=1 Tax=Sphingosinicella sp. TaxID=1917971 RepID=UPI004037ADA9
MRRALATLFLALSLAAPLSAAERRYPVTDFDRIEVDGPYLVRLTTGRTSLAVATGPQAGIDRLTVEVSGQTLRIRRNRSGWTGTPGARQGQIEIAVTTRGLRAARLIGPGRLEIDRLAAMRADLGVEGSGELVANGTATDVLNLRLAGSGRLVARGRTRRLNGVFEGSGNVDASGLLAQDVVAATTSFGEVALSAARTARITASGRGAVTVAGRPACTVLGPSADLVRCGPLQQP